MEETDAQKDTEKRDRETPETDKTETLREGLHGSEALVLGPRPLKS